MTLEEENKILKQENEGLKQRAELNQIDKYYIMLIREYARIEALEAVKDILRKPVKMTHAEIESALGLKIELVD